MIDGALVAGPTPSDCRCRSASVSTSRRASATGDPIVFQQGSLRLKHGEPRLTALKLWRQLDVVCHQHGGANA